MPPLQSARNTPRGRSPAAGEDQPIHCLHDRQKVDGQLPGRGGTGMAVDNFVAYVGVYSDVAHAEADYELVKDLHTRAGLLDAYDAAVIERRDDGKERITRQHETPTRAGGGPGGGGGRGPGLVEDVFPFPRRRGG